jgi:3,4-dihydroxy 2-butanone 4-phosphate synthase/GTP cyclohydrolase II
MALATIPEAVEDIRQGRMVIIVDDEDRENEGDLACAAEKVTPEIINFMATHAKGLICMPLVGQRLDELGLRLMVGDAANSSPNPRLSPSPLTLKQPASLPRNGQ